MRINDIIIYLLCSQTCSPAYAAVQQCLSALAVTPPRVSENIASVYPEVHRGTRFCNESNRKKVI